jgi:hypothetical protein
MRNMFMQVHAAICALGCGSVLAGTAFERRPASAAAAGSIAQ